MGRKWLHGDEVRQARLHGTSPQLPLVQHQRPGFLPALRALVQFARNINNLVGIFGDKEWGALQPGSKGWILGFKYVPAKNIEWETFYEMATAQNTLYGHKNETYHRNFVRTMVDYHF